MKKFSIKTKLLFITGFMVFLVIAGLVLNSNINQKKLLKKALNLEIKANGEILTFLLEPMLDLGIKDNNIIDVINSVIKNNKNITGIAVYKEYGKSAWLDIIKSKGKGLFKFNIGKKGNKLGILKIYYNEDEMNKEINKAFYSNMLLGLLFFLLSLLVISFIFERIKRRLKLLIKISNMIAKGDLEKAREVLSKALIMWNVGSDFQDLEENVFMKEINDGESFNSNDELGLVLIEFYSMVSNLGNLLKRIKKTEDDVSKSAEEISLEAKWIETASIKQSASMHQISVTNEEVSATSKELYSNMEKIGTEIKKAVGVANTGKDSLSKMEEAMTLLIKSTKSISSKLAVINSKTNKISGVSTTINSISDQTNLLSINAAIEAEKAGEYGKGFLVIAKEINHLANQTTVATKEIESMVEEMQSSVLSGVMEMDKFSGEVKKRVDDVDLIGDNLTEIIERVQGIAPEFEVVKEGMIVQTNATTQIGESMSQLVDSSKQTKNSIIEFKTVTDVLKNAVSRLRDEILRFKL